MSATPRLEATSMLHLVGSRVYDRKGAPVGRIEDLITDVASGRIVFAVLSLGELLDTEAILVAVPWATVSRAGAERRRVVIDVPQEQLRVAPSFDAHRWPDLGDPVWGRQVYAYYGCQPYWEETPASPARVAVRQTRRPERRSSAGWVLAAFVVLAVIGVGAYFAIAQDQDARRTVDQAAQAVKETSQDAATTVKVTAALALSERVPASQIDVDVRDGVVTLRGTVGSASVRDLAGTIARDTSGVTAVHNLLRVSGGTDGEPAPGAASASPTPVATPTPTTL